MIVDINRIFKYIWYVSFDSKRDKRFTSVQLTYSTIMMDPDAPGQKWFCIIWYGNLSFRESYGRTKFEAYRKALSKIDLKHVEKLNR